MDKIKTWVRQNPKEFVVLLLILLVGALLRLYKIDSYMTFLGDEGRDAIIVRRLLVNFDPILIGPGTSIGNMYLGPLYYYMMAPALLVSNFSPVGPAVMVALLGVATIFFVWHVGREWFSPTAGLIAAFLYAVSPTVIIYSRSSWNPNIMPFFSLLSIYSIWRVWKKHEWKWLIILGISFAFVLQSHYLGLLLAPTIFIFWLLSHPPVRYTLYGLGLFLFLMSPLAIFDARHGWNNFNAMKTFFTVRQETVSVRPWNAVPNLWPIYKDVMTRLPAGRNETLGLVLSVITLATALFLAFKRKLLTANYLLPVAWLGFGLLGLGIYKQQIYDHYYGFFFAVPFLLLGAIAQGLGTRQKAIVAAGLAILVFVNLKSSPILSPPTMQLERAKEVAAKIADESNGEKFNLAVIAERNYEDGYQYLLEKDSHKVVDIDAQRPETITNQLFVVCEMPKEKCDPTHNAKAEVANFGWSKVDGEWDVFGVTIYKLIHSQ